MDDYTISNQSCYEHKLWKKALCVFLAVIIGFGTVVTLIVGSSRLQDWLGVRTMLSAYAAEIVDTKGVVAINEDVMKDDNTVIDVENLDGSNTSYIFSEPISFIDTNGNIKTKDISVEKQTDESLIKKGYDYTNGQNNYRINFSSDSAKGVYVKSDDVSYYIIPKGENTVKGVENTSILLNEKFEVFEYPNIYGRGTSLKFYPQLNGIKDEIVLDKNIGKNQFSFELKTENCTAVLNEDGTVSLVDSSNGETVQTFNAPFAYDSEYVEGEYNENYIDCTYSLEKVSENTYKLTVTVDTDWLNSENTVYPVVIDPTTSDLSNYRDAGVYSAKSTTCYGKETTACFGRASEYGYGRVLNQFTMPSAIKKGATINSAYTWQRETTGRTTTTYVRPYMVTSSWSESTVTWSEKPTYSTSVYGTKKKISSASTDDTVDNNPYWYKFSIKSMVQKWIDEEEPNYGFIFVSNEESDKNYNWRAFTTKQYSNSLMRPYTVINYTNDTTAPTASVAKSTTAWTNSSVKLTITASDSGAGITGANYYFSTVNSTSGTWTSSKSKTFSSNCTVYVKVKDDVGNVKNLSAVTIDKIDKVAPVISSVEEVSQADGSVVVTVNATDSASGISGYSFDGGTTWQTNESKTVTGAYTIKVKDNAGNITAIDSDVEAPLIYHENNQICLVSQNNDETDMEYKIVENGVTTQDWTTYNDNDNINISANTNATVYARDTASPERYRTLNCINNIGHFEDSATDFAISFFDASFDFSRYYSSLDNSWFYSVDSNISVVEADKIYKAKLTDSTTLYFISGEDGVFANNYTGYILQPVYNDSQQLTGYTIDMDGIIYGYNSNGLISYVEDEDGHKINITRGDNTVTVSYGTETDQRTYTISYTDGLVSSVTTPLDEIISYTYDSGNLTKVAYNSDDMIITRDGGIILSEYSYTNGVMTTYNGATIEYNTNGFVSIITEKSGAYTNYTYPTPTAENVAFVITTVDQSGNESTVNYDFELNVLEVEQDDETVAQYSYDEDGNVEFDGTTYYEYNDDGTIKSETSSDYSATYSYVEGTDNIESVAYTTTEDGETGDETSTASSDETTTSTTEATIYTYYIYNEDDTVAKSFESTKELGEDANLVAEYDLATNKVEYTYTNGKLTKTVEFYSDDEVKTETITEYGDKTEKITVKTTPIIDESSFANINDVVAEDDTQDTSTSTETDETVTDEDTTDVTVTAQTTTTITEYFYDDFNNLDKEIYTDEDNEETTTDYEYDKLNRQTKVTCDGVVTEYIYDSIGNVLLETTTDGDVTDVYRTVYDKYGNVLQEITTDDGYNSQNDSINFDDLYSDNSVGMRYTYDSTTGNLSTETNQHNVVTTYGYTNGWCSTETITDSQNQYSYVYTYNSNGNVLTVVINGQNYATYTYNDDNQLTNLLYGNGDSVQYSYDENGNCIAQYKNNDTTPFVTMTYAQDDEENYYVSSKTYDDTKQRVEYNSNGEIEKIYRVVDNTETLIVDNTGDSQQIGGYEVITEEDDDSITYTSSSSANSIKKILRYSYSSDDNTNSYSVTHQASNYTTIHNVLSATETYSNDGNLEQIDYTYNNGNSTSTHTAQYDDQNRVTQTTQGQYLTSYQYDQDGRLIRENATVDNFTAIYEYDERGNLYTKKQYDYSTGEVDESTLDDIGGEYSYTDDLWIDCLDKMVSTTDDSFMEISYDVNGNPVEYKYGDLVMTEYQWDGRNLTSISTLNEDTGETAEIARFTYDENGMRTSKTYEGVTTYFVYDGGTLLSQYDMDTTGAISNIMFFLYDESDEISGVNYNGSFYYYQKDILGSVVGAYDYTGKSTHSANYDAWGHNYLSSVSNSSFQSVNPIGYRGYYYDKGISMFYLQSRYYDPVFGRFLNADDPQMLQYTKNTQDGLNLFAYCNNDPINNTDPSGTDPMIYVYILYDPDDFKKQAEHEKKKWESNLSYRVVKTKALKNKNAFIDYWNNKINPNSIVIMIFHGGPYHIHITNDDFKGSDVNKLKNKKISQLKIYACNCGHKDVKDNIAKKIKARLSKTKSIYVMDGSISYYPLYGRFKYKYYNPRLSTNQSAYYKYASTVLIRYANGRYLYTRRAPTGLYKI